MSFSFLYEYGIPLAEADPDLELRRGGGGGDGGLDLLAVPAIFPSVISSFFTQTKGGGEGGAAKGEGPPKLRYNVHEKSLIEGECQKHRRQRGKKD